MKNTNVTKNIETYTCPICGAEIPVRFAVDASYGHVCYSCAMKLYDAHDCGRFGKYGRLLGTTAWNGAIITRDMAKEAYELMNEKFDTGETLDPHFRFHDCVMVGVFHTEMALLLDKKDWKETYREYCTDAFVERGEDTFTLEEVMVCTYSMFQNNAVHNHEAKFWIENSLV
jgi:hypothetical protein